MNSPLESHVKSCRWALPAVAAAVLALLVLPLAACGGGGEAEVEESLEETGTLDILEQASEDEYEPPADGELTEEQVEMYLAVQERAVKIRQVTGKRLEEKQAEAEGSEGGEIGFMDAMRAMGEVSDFVTADIRAAKELGHNSAEYQWVQEKVMEAQAAKMTAGFAEQASAAGQQFLTMMQEQLAKTEDAEQRAALEQQIAEYEASMAENQGEGELEPAVEHNMELLAEYQEEIDRIQQSYQALGEEVGN